MSEYLKPQSPIKYKKDDAYIYPLTTADQVLLDDNTRLNAALDDINTKIENMDFGDINIEGLDDMVQINLNGAVDGKPQSPLQHKDGAFLYPLTTADQVILEDNSRLNAVLENFATEDKINSAIKAIDFPIDSVNGKTGAVHLGASDVGAVPTSRTINGKALSDNISLSTSDIGAQEKHNTKIVSLTASNWSNFTQTVSVSGVTANSTIVVTPAPASHAVYGEAGVYCSAQSNGTLTFACSETPATNLNVNVLILN